MEFPIALAYNMEDRKVGCVLLQAAMGGFGQVGKYFPSETWELSLSKVKMFLINNQEEFDRVVAITTRSHLKDTYG